MTSPAAVADTDCDDATFQAWYGTVLPLAPAAVAALFEGSGVRWWVAGGRAARVGAAPRQHQDTDVGIRFSDLPALRRHLPDWHFWEAASGTLRPLLPGVALGADREQLWLRRDAQHPWEIDLLLQRGRPSGCSRRTRACTCRGSRRCTRSAGSATCGPRSRSCTRRI